MPEQNPEVSILDDLSDLPGSARVLFDAAERASFDLGRDWFELLAASALAGAERPRYYMLSSGGRVRCILPLLLTPGRACSLTNFYSGLFRPLLAEGVEAEELAVLFRQVIADVHPYSVRLHAMDPGHASFPLTLAALRLAGLQSYPYFAFGNWFEPVAGRGYEAYFAALSSRVRNTVRRRSKKFFGAAGGRVEILSQGADVARAVEAWDTVYAASWKRAEPFAGFMPGLIALCERRGWLRMGIAYLGDQPIAAQLWIVNAGRASIYKLAYDQAYERYSAGTILTAQLMRHVLDEDRVREVDYLIGDDDYKKDWVSHRRPRHGLVAYDRHRLRGLKGIVVHELGQAWRRLRGPVGEGGETRRGP